MAREISAASSAHGPACVKTKIRVAEIVSQLEDVAFKARGPVAVLAPLVAIRCLSRDRFELILAHMSLRSFHTPWAGYGLPRGAFGYAVAE